MPSIIRKYIKLSPLVVVPVLLILNIAFRDTAVVKDVVASRASNTDFYHEMRFEIATEVSIDGIEYSVLNLYSKDGQTSSKPTLGFIISKEKSLGKIGPAKYHIAKDSDGFLNYIGGVFGFAETHDSGRLPFFAHSGEIEILQFDDELLKGSMNLHFRNTFGESIRIQGDFRASP